MITAVVRNYIKFTNDLESDLVYSSELADSPAIQELVSLALGDNVITVPVVSGFTVHGVAIVPPVLNTEEPILKADIADVGISLSASGVSILQFGATPPTQIVLVTSAAVAGFRLIWF